MSNYFYNLCDDILLIIASFIIEPKYKLLKWIDNTKIDLYYLCANPSPNVFNYILENYNMNDINWHVISMNPSAIKFIEKEIINGNNNVNWGVLSKNPAAVHILENNINKIDWNILLENESMEAITLLCKYPDKINNKIFRNKYAVKMIENKIDNIEPDDLYYIASNINAIHIIENNMNNIHNNNTMHQLCKNENAIHIIEKLDTNNINWYNLCSNKNAIPIIRKNMDKIIWDALCMNTSKEAMEMLENNMDKIIYMMLSMNPSIFEVDIKETTKLYIHYIKSLFNSI